MHLIAPLTAGVRGAENGVARIYKRGTSQKAWAFGDFYGTVPLVSSTEPYTEVILDQHGGAVVFVDEMVDVHVHAKGGETVRAFTAGVSSPAVEVRSPSLTGADYVTAESGVNKPTTLQVALDRWKEENGSTDWKVGFLGEELSIPDALLETGRGQLSILPLNTNGGTVPVPVERNELRYIQIQDGGDYTLNFGDPSALGEWFELVMINFHSSPSGDITISNLLADTTSGGISGTKNYDSGTIVTARFRSMDAGSGAAWVQIGGVWKQVLF